MNATPCITPSAADSDPVSREIDASCRVPLFVLFFSGAIWLVVSSILGLIASIKFHSPNFLADCASMTYGRVYPAATNALLYGFAIPAGLGVGLWIIARLGQTRVVQPWIIAFGAKIWNLGVLVGIFGILNGDSTGFENLEMPKHAAILLFIGYSLMGIWTLLTLQSRREKSLQAPQWFLIAALFWFPWIFSTAQLLLTVHPVRGVTQSVINWWFSANLKLVWLGLVGLAVSFFFLVKLMNRALYSQYLAYFTFWTIILFASWSGIPATAPLPAWIPTLSGIATVLTLVTVLAVAVNVYRTCGQGCDRAENPTPGKFIAFGVMAFVVSGLLNVAGSLPELTRFTHFTWYTVAQSHLNVCGFFTMTMLGAIYYIVPKVIGVEWPCCKPIKAHYWVALVGILLFAVPLAIGGVLQGIKLANPEIAFADLTKGTVHFLRISSMGEMLILIGHLLFLGNFIALCIRLARLYLVPAGLDAITEVKPAEAKS
ncbi:MAG: cbb3-type cytochrome c oxidase subunit I [Akkermansiaceae bacterium]|nr:cbb3-type cytochrome c oxidase subunit I [Verrucomicrobiales bacterium]